MQEAGQLHTGLSVIKTGAFAESQHLRRTQCSRKGGGNEENWVLWPPLSYRH